MPVNLGDFSRRALGWIPALIPSCCALCKRVTQHALCSACHHKFFNQPVQRCWQCAMTLPKIAANFNLQQPIERCGACLHRPPAFDQTIVAVDYAAPLDQLVLALKFGARLALAPWFARMQADALLHNLQRPETLPDVLIAVPLGARRLAQRGFNQAHEIARPLARALGVPLERRLIVRTRDTAAQAQLHPSARHKNIRHAFMPNPETAGKLRGLHVGVVDDVMTTGETLNELATTLKRFGAARVTNLVFARTVPK